MASADLAPTRKLEAHLAATESLTEVLYVEVWGEIGDQLAQKCAVGEFVAIQGGVVENPGAIERQTKGWPGNGVQCHCAAGRNPRPLLFLA